MKYIFRFSLLIFFLFVLPDVYGQSQVSDDSSHVNLRQFKSDGIEQYRGKAEFTYETPPPENLNLFQLMMYYLGKLFEKLFSADEQLTVYKIIAYVLMVGSIIFIVLNLMGVDIRRVFVRDSKTFTPYSTETEDIRELNLDDLIKEAAARGDWKLCIRYQYLKALRLLTDRELINWQPGKTNMDYYYELKPADLKGNFIHVTDVFETAWYGNAGIDETGYKETSKGFEKFYEEINNYRT